MISVCFTYFRSLALANLRAALYSVRQQDLSSVERIIIVDNNTEDAVESIQNEIDALAFPVPTMLHSHKHGDETKTHPWSTNEAVRHATAPWVLFSRADYILDFNLLSRFSAVVRERPQTWDGFVTANVFHLNADIAACEATPWRGSGVSALRALPGIEEDHTVIDSGVWLARKESFARVHGLNESLSAWGHAQTHFQYKLFATGTEFIRIPEPLFFHPRHSAPRDLALAHEQLAQQGVELKEMWRRYAGRSPY